MRFFASLQQTFGFTRNEILVILFLTVTFLIGLGIRWYNDSAKRAGAPVHEFDYSRSDSIFLERSKKLAALSDPAKTRSLRPERDGSTPRKAVRALSPSSININTATKDDLMQLPGIGESYAERIILDREDHGSYTSVDDLMRVKGIGKKTMERIRPFVTIK
jgi:competence protein ComEA